MDAKLCNSNPRRIPQWRAERVNYLVDYPRLSLQSSDDRYIRSYRRLRLLWEAAGCDETKLFRASIKQPYAYVAHSIRFGPNREFRYALEAWLLTSESLAKIASRLNIEKEMVAFYAALFFDVRDRRRDAEWIHEIILGPWYPLAPYLNGAMSEEERGFLFRMFASLGGPDVLDAVIQSIGSSTMPDSRDDAERWLEKAVERIVHVWAATARKPARDQDAISRLLGLAVGPSPMGKISKAFQRPPRDLEKFAAKFMAQISLPIRNDVESVTL
jgi:hypothetical protein